MCVPRMVGDTPHFSFFIFGLFKLRFFLKIFWVMVSEFYGLFSFSFFLSDRVRSASVSLQQSLRSSWAGEQRETKKNL